ncbi:MAG: hypothetical protein ABIH82_06230 [Candidatus Woesearchaeota archaeon]
MLIGKTLLEEEKVINLICDIRKRKTLEDLNEDFVREQLFQYLNKNHKLAANLNGNFHTKSAIYKKVMKEVREQLRRVYGLYRIDVEKEYRKKLVNELIEGKDLVTNVKKILETHSSTKERLTFYSKLYDKIFKITGKPKSIIDLGCGVNPFSIPFMDLNKTNKSAKITKLNYYAYDISEEEIQALNEFFAYLSKQNKYFWGHAKVLDIFTLAEIEHHDNIDICFLLKMTDVLDRGKGHKVSEEVITKVPAKYVVVSFSTKTMSGKEMNFPERKWIELMCERLKYKIEKFRFSNEIFYVIKK